MRIELTGIFQVLVDLAGVGQNLWDHPVFGPSYEVNFDTLDRILTNLTQLVQGLTDYVSESTGPLTSNLVDILGWEKLPQKYHDTFSNETNAALAQFPSDWAEVEYISANGYLGTFEFPILQQPLDGKQYASILGAMVAPISRGNVTISSADTSDLPLINPNYLGEKADQEVAVAWYRRMREVFATDALKPVIIGKEFCESVSSFCVSVPGD
jgi:choline dehydrogenase-like flavoprotein